MAGQFIWSELMTTDLERSAAFFAGLLECDVVRTDEDPPSYFAAPRNTESPMFGLVAIKAESGQRSHWVGTLMVDDVDQALAHTEEAGGALHAISDDVEGRDPDEPRFAIVTDPQGAVVNLHQRVDGAIASDDLPGIGQIAWIELLTTDREGAAAFYKAIADFDVGPEHDRAQEGVAHALSRSGRTFGLLRDLPAGSPVPPHWVFYRRVADLELAIRHVRALGGFMYEDPAEVDGGRRVLMLDPTGAPVALWAARRPVGS